MKHKKINLDKRDIDFLNGVYVMRCPLCGNITASASELDFMPEIGDCTGIDTSSKIYHIEKATRKFKEKVRAVALYKQGVHLDRIAEETNMSKSTIRRIVKERGVEIRPEGSPRTYKKEKESEVIRLYKEDIPILEIMRRTGVKSEQTVYSILRRNSIELRKK